MTLTVSVYEKQGICRGRPIINASFFATRTGFIGLNMYLRILKAPVPLDPASATYLVLEPRLPATQSWTLRVSAVGYESWDFNVLNGETHEVWLSPRPG